MGHRSSKRGSVAVALAAVVGLVGVLLPPTVVAAQGEELIVNGGFETGDFTGWTIADHPEPYEPIAVVGAGVTSRFGLFTTEPSGDAAALHAFDGGGPGTIELAQEIAIPDGKGARLTFEFRAGWDLDRWCAGCNRDRTLDVEIRSGSGSVLGRTNLLTVSPGSTTTDTGVRLVDIDLSAYTGQTVVMAIVATVPGDFTGPARVQIDNVSVLTEPLAASSTTVPTTLPTTPGDGIGVAGPAQPVAATPAFTG